MKILVGMSGGVDSSVTAALLKSQGHEVIGATMSIWDQSTDFHGRLTTDSCFSPHEKEDIETARLLCEQLDIPYHVIDCSKRYKQMVLENFKSEYKAGRTPNPCVMCNSYIKFKALPEEAAAEGIKFDKFATGHYAQIKFNQDTNRYEIKRGVDFTKDQSYFLYRLTQEQLSKIEMPLGQFTKKQVRELAEKFGLAVADKPDSQDFYSGDINDILQNTPKTGNFVTSTGKILGQHQGYWNYTIGQRRGMGIAAAHPLYVIGINKDQNEVVVGFEEECQKSGLIATDLCWSAISAPDQPIECEAKIRSSQQPTSVKLLPQDDNSIKVDFYMQQKAIAPGQSVVFYKNDVLLGGGIIRKSL